MWYIYSYSWQEYKDKNSFLFTCSSSNARSLIPGNKLVSPHNVSTSCGTALAPHCRLSCILLNTAESSWDPWGSVPHLEYVTHVTEIQQNNLHLERKCDIDITYLAHYVSNSIFIQPPVWPFEAYGFCMLDKEIHVWGRNAHTVNLLDTLMTKTYD